MDLRDDLVALPASRLPEGAHEYVYYTRATTPGDFFVAPAHAVETHFQEIFGRSGSGRFTVSASEEGRRDESRVPLVGAPSD